MKVGRRQLDIAQARHLEGSVRDDRLWRRRAEPFDRGEPIPKVILCPKTQVLDGAKHTGVVEAAVRRLPVSDARRIDTDLANRGVGELRPS